MRSMLNSVQGTSVAVHVLFIFSVGNRTELRAVHGTGNDFKNTYTYDKLRRLTEVTQTSQASGNAVLPKRVALEYNALGQRTKISRFESTGTTNAVATTDFTYDFANRLSSIAHKQGTTNLNTHSYLYDPLSRLSSMTSTLDGTINYTYDQRSQLTIADDGQPYSPGHPTRLGERYEYDDNGNREGAGITVLADNRITAAPGETYTYDNEGNVVGIVTSIGVGSKSFQWDHRNRLIQSMVNTGSGIVTVNYTYDPFNRLVKRSEGFNTTYFGYDEGINPQLQMDTQSSNQITHRYLWSDQVDELFADEQNLAGLVPDTKWALSDHQGTIKDIADFNSSTGQTSVRHRAYDSFGNRKGSALPTDIVFGYTGKYFDELTGMQNSWNRWYSPKMGRFISQDPIGFAAGDANLYRYVGNSPTMATDPSGLEKVLGISFSEDNVTQIAATYTDWCEDNIHIDIDKSHSQNKVGNSVDSKYERKKNDIKQKGDKPGSNWKPRKAVSNPIDWPKAIKELDDLIAAGDKFDSVVFTGHGSPGWMGGVTLTDLQSVNSATPTDAGRFIQKLNQLLNPGGKIDIRHCSVAKNQVGKDFLQQMSNVTGASVTGIDDWYAIWPHGTEWTAQPGGNGPTAGTKHPSYPGFPNPIRKYGK